MSRYDWEKGTLKIPAKAWKPLRDGLANAFNDRQGKLYELALKLHEKLLEIKKQAKRGTFKAEQALATLIDGRANSISLWCEYGNEAELVKASLLGPYSSRTGALLLPKKKDFPLAVSTKTTSYDAEEGTISLNHKTMELHWRVSENNHAVERARDSYMGKTMFALLDKVEWTRGSGGEFVGNDDINRDNEDSGGGGNYTTATYRMKTKAELESEQRQRRHLNISYGGYGMIGYRR
jgi:hypothetical protein